MWFKKTDIGFISLVMSLGRVLFILFWHGISLGIRMVIRKFCGKGSTVETLIGRSLANLCQALGGAYLKFGQMLSTRLDLLPLEIIRELSLLQDRVSPLPWSKIRPILDQSLAKPLYEIFEFIDSMPIASASFAQVHRAMVRATGQEVALKVKRPGIRKTVERDLAFICLVVGCVRQAYPLRGIPLLESFQSLENAMLSQSDFRKEAENNRRFQAIFAGSADIQVPILIEELCTDELVTMEYIPGLIKLTDEAQEKTLRQKAVVLGLRALYKMIFSAGFIHCDLHPGNILCKSDGGVVILDMGFVAELHGREKQAFTDFFMSLVSSDAKAASKIILNMALRVPGTLNDAGFEQDIRELIQKTSGRKASEFQVGQFVVALFEIQRRHRIYGSPAFSLAILSLFVFEGIVKNVCPHLNFQQEAVPQIMIALVTLH